jgi:serralysin
VGPGGEVLLLADQGAYHPTNEIAITHGGTTGAPVTIRGVDSAGNPMAAEIVGTRAEDWQPGLSTGRELFRLLTGADNLCFQDLSISNVGNGAFRIGADITNLTIRNVDAANVTRFLEDYSSGSNTSASVTGLTVQNVTIAGYSLGAIRLQYNSSNILIENVVGDSERQPGGQYIFGVAITGTAHDIVLRNVEMKNNWGQGEPGTYWNGDGFSTERGVYNVLFENTKASGNTDAGYDLKSSNTVLKNAMAEANDRNFRIWSNSVTMIDCTSLNPTHGGGIGSLSHIWLVKDAAVTIDNLSVSDAGTPRTLFDLADGNARVTLRDTIIPAAYTNLIHFGSNSTIEIANSVDPVSTTSLIRAGGSGHDTLIGGAGNDTLRGRGGNDIYIVNAAGDQVIERSNEGNDTVQVSLSSYRLPTYVEALIFAGTGDFVAVGNSSHNVMTAGAGSDTLRGGEGNDTLSGGAGLDTLSGDNGNDSLLGGDGADQLQGGFGTDQIWGDAGDDSLFGNDGFDKLYGGDGSDVLDGGLHNDRMEGGTGNDTYVVNAIGDAVVEQSGEGTDSVVSNLTYALTANVENLTLTGSKVTNGTGNELANVLIGNSAGNVLKGGAGDDILAGGAGNDTLNGESGADTYLFGRGDGRDSIYNRDADGSPDTLVLGPDISADQLWFTRSGGDLVISILGSRDTAVIKNWYTTTGYCIDRIELSDGGYLEASQVQSLVTAMASFQSAPASLVSLTPQQQQTIETAVAANWQSEA